MSPKEDKGRIILQLPFAQASIFKKMKRGSNSRHFKIFLPIWQIWYEKYALLQEAAVFGGESKQGIRVRFNRGILSESFDPLSLSLFICRVKVLINLISRAVFSLKRLCYRV
jgi:hypothetical protein